MYGPLEMGVETMIIAIATVTPTRFTLFLFRAQRKMEMFLGTVKLVARPWQRLTAAVALVKDKSLQRIYITLVLIVTQAQVRLLPWRPE